WAAQERSNNKFIQFFWNRFGLGMIPLAGFWLIGPLGLLGGAVLWPRKRRLSLLYLFVLTYMAGVVLFFVNGRFRLPVTPILIIFASYAIHHVILSVRSRRADLLKVILILLVCVAFVNYDYISFRGVRALDEAISYYELGNAFLRLEDKDAALAEFERAHSIQVQYPTRGYLQIAGSVDFQIGMIYWEKGLYTRAIDALERIRDDYPRSDQAKLILAECYITRGRVDDAIRIFEQKPDDARSVMGLGVAYRMKGDYERSAAAFGRVLELENQPDGIVRLELARTLALKGDIDGAVLNYRLAATSSSHRRDAYLELARLLSKTGDVDSALEILTRLRNAYPNDREIQAELNARRESQ
ncbi:MAG: tetratricopeptide repeat protein, partial [Candidatus Latescibacterota bacterium]